MHTQCYRDHPCQLSLDSLSTNTQHQTGFLDSSLEYGLLILCSSFCFPFWCLGLPFPFTLCRLGRDYPPSFIILHTPFVEQPSPTNAPCNLFVAAFAGLCASFSFRRHTSCTAALQTPSCSFHTRCRGHGQHSNSVLPLLSRSSSGSYHLFHILILYASA